MPETYPTGGAKNFIHGIDYQKLWLMLFFRRAVNRKYFFRLATEMSSAAGFDDIVFRYEQNGTTVCMLIQVKHKQDDSKKICVGDLLTKSGELNLVKHFAAFLKIRGNEEFKDKIKGFFIVINVDFDRESLASKGITVEKIETQDEFLNIGDSAKYKLRDLRNNIAQYLKQGMSAGGREVSDEEIKGFLNELVFVVNSPNDAELEKLIRNEITDDLARRFKYFGDNGYVFNALFTMMSSWMKDKRGRFLSPEEGEKFFREVEKLPSTLGRIELVLEEIKKGLDSMMGEKSASDDTQQAHFHKEPIWFNMRYPVKMFIGRSELQKIYKELHKTTNEQAEVSQIVVISGLGGIGKSELARKYAYEYRKDYDGNVIWINAETQKDLEESFEGLARELNRRKGSKISTTEEGIGSIIEGVYRYFEDVKGLFIFDSAEGYKNISKFLPSSLNYRPYVLITSRDTKWKLGQKIEMEVTRLDVFEEPEALEFVEKFLDIDNASQDKEIEELAEELQYFPLALKQAVAYIRNKNKESKLRDYGRFEISDYLKEYQQHPEKLLKEGVYENEDCYTKTIFTTWDVTIEAIKRKECGIEALSILGVMAYLTLDDIRIKEIFPKSTEDDKKKLWNAVKLLDRYSMIDLRKRTVNIRRLVQKVIRLKLQEKGQEEETLRKALELINSNDVVKEDVSHIISVWEYASKHGKLIDEFYFSSVYVRKVMFSKENKESNPLHLLAEDGSCKAIMAILTYVEKYHLDKLGEVINIKDNRGRTLLHIAAYNSKLDVVEYLISKGADFSAKDKLNGTPLHSAAEGGNYEVVKAVLTHTEKKHSGGLSKVVNAKTKDGNAPLHLAAYSGNLDVVECLIKKGANVDAKNGDNETPLHYAAISGNLKVVEYLVGKDTYSNVRTEFGDTLLHLAVKSERLEVVKYYVEKGVGVNVKNKYNETPLHYAADNGNLEIMKYLIEKGANVNAKGKNDETPLHLAIHMATFSGDLSIVKYLINKGADVNATNWCNDTLLHRFAKDGNLEIMEYLIEKGAQVNAKGKNDETPLHLATHMTTFSEDLSIVKYLINKGADVNVKNGNNETPLYIAVGDGNLEIIKYLIERGANVNAKGKEGETPLHLAAMMGKVDIAMVLLKHNANVNARNNWGMTVLGYAADQELAELLLAHGASIL